MDDRTVGSIEEKMCYKALINQIYDYLMENVSVDDLPTMNTCLGFDAMEESLLSGILGSVAILMEEATDDTKQRIKEELLGKYEDG